MTTYSDNTSRPVFGHWYPGQAVEAVPREASRVRWPGGASLRPVAVAAPVAGAVCGPGGAETAPKFESSPLGQP